MMRQTFTCHLGLAWGDIEADVTVRYSVDWGRPATREDPEEPAAIDDIEIVEVDGRPWNREGDWWRFGNSFPEADDDLVEKVLDEKTDQLLEHATGAVVASEPDD
jgi:hypothetical protein